jgi:NADPH-dependent 2,4-dienoyl-CoA reductase/sulfur reductase-like enzyme/nitrite reductase/ring-hydroxylating ferredoxin subunit
MGQAPAPLTGPDLTQGVELSELEEGGLRLGNAHGEPVLLVRDRGEVFAVAATCTHYGGPLAEGIVTDGEVRCPWHHACFELRTGAASRPPALNPLRRWKVERRGSRVFVGQPLDAPSPPRAAASTVASVVIVGAGAAGNAAAEALRREGYPGPVTLIGAEATGPVDRPNLSKDYLAGAAPEDWMPLRGPEFYAAQRIELLTGTRVVAVDLQARQVQLSDGTARSYGALLLATGADPVKLTVPGGDGPLVHSLRSFADSRAIIASATSATRAVVVGASFIGLEVAAALRTRGLEVRVVAPEARPLERVMGPELGGFIRSLHEEHGVRFHLQHTLASVGDGAVTLDDGTTLPADLVVAGVGVRPSVGLAEQAGLRLDRGILVDPYLETSAPGVYAAGDVARWPDPHTGRAIRVEHWVVAERQGQAAARNILGARQPFRAVPFFWSQHYDLTISYVGHADGWDRLEVAGPLAQKSGLVAFRVAGRISAVATVNRDQESLWAEALLEQGDQPGLEALLAGNR